MKTVETHRRYIDLFRAGSFKTLGHFADELFAEYNLRSFFKILTESIVPLLTKAKAFGPFYLQWVKDKSDFKKKYERTEMAAIKEMHDVFAKVRALLDSENMIENPAINQGLSSVENVLEGRDGHRYFTPPYYEVAYDRLCGLCGSILEVGRVDLMKDFGEIVYTNGSKVNPKTQEVTYVQVPSFLSFSFAPVRTQLLALNKAFLWDNLDHEWAMWEHFLLAEWCWKIPSSYFENKILESQDIEACAKSNSLMSNHAYWVEMHQIKNGKIPQHIRFFQRDRFIQYLKPILNKILLHQEIDVNESIAPKEITPYSLQLKLDDNELQLEVVWFKDAEAECFIVHKFKNDSSNQRLMQLLLQTEPGQKVSVEDSKLQNIAKFFERTHLKGFLEQIFFRKIDQYSASPKNHVALIEKYPKIPIDELVAYIKSLEKIEGFWLHTRDNHQEGK